MPPNKDLDFRPIITVTGMGMTFDVEFEIIKRALELAGIKVEVQNDYPPKGNPLTLEQLEHRKNGYGVILRANHEPWPG